MTDKDELVRRQWGASEGPEAAAPDAGVPNLLDGELLYPQTWDVYVSHFHAYKKTVLLNDFTELRAAYERAQESVWTSHKAAMLAIDRYNEMEDRAEAAEAALAALRKGICDALTREKE